MSGRFLIPRSMSVLTLLLVGSACHEGEYGGGILTYRSALRADGTMVNGGGECTMIALGHSTGASVSRPSWHWFALYGKSEGGELHQELHIQPEGAPPDFEVTAENGEVAMEWTFTPGDLGEDDYITDEITTHTDDVIWISHWGEEDCSDGKPPEDFEPPGP